MRSEIDFSLSRFFNLSALLKINLHLYSYPSVFSDNATP